MRKRLLAMFLVLVLAMSNLGGISVAHAEEASSPKVTAEPEGGGETEVDNTVLNVKTVDKDGNPVAGVELMLEAVSEWGENVHLEQQTIQVNILMKLNGNMMHIY